MGGNAKQRIDMKAEELEAMLFDVYKHGVEHEDCDLTRRVRKIEQHTNQRVIEELEEIKFGWEWDIPVGLHKWIKRRLKDLKQE